MLHHCNESYETARLLQIAEDEHRLQFKEAIQSYANAENGTHRARLVETIVRTSRSVTDDPGALPDDVKDGLLQLLQFFHAFGPVEIVVPATYGAAREIIKTYFF